MKFALAPEHRDFFSKNHYVEFEELFKAEQIIELDLGVKQILLRRLGTTQDQLKRHSVQDLYMAGHDLWRSDEQVRRKVTQPKLAEIAYELIEIKPLRLGLDQLFLGPIKTHLNSHHPQLGPTLTQATLKDVTSLQGVLCGLMLCLSAPKVNNFENRENSSINIFSKTAGNGIYFNPDVPIDFSSLTQCEEGRYLLIVYVHSTSVYIFEERDTHAYDLKQMGYIYGDKLNDKLHPIVYR